MYGLPPDVDLSFFVDTQVTLVSFGWHFVGVEFIGNPYDPHSSISIEGAYSLQLPEGDKHTWHDNLRQGAAYLVAIVALRVASAVGTPNGTLTLTFKGGGVLEVHDSEKHYESYQIRYGDKIIVV